MRAAPPGAGECGAPLLTVKVNEYAPRLASRLAAGAAPRPNIRSRSSPCGSGRQKRGKQNLGYARTLHGILRTLCIGVRGAKMSAE